MNKTLAIIKPDAVQSGKTGKIVAHLEQSGFTLRALRLTRLDSERAANFYEVHREKPFYAALVSFMTSGASIPIVLEADDEGKYFQACWFVRTPRRLCRRLRNAILVPTVKKSTAGSQ